MPDVIRTEVLEIEYEKVFPPVRVTELFELQFGDHRRFFGWDRPREDTYRLLDQDGKRIKDFKNRSEFEEHLETAMRGKILSQA